MQPREGRGLGMETQQHSHFLFLQFVFPEKYILFGQTAQRQFPA